MTDSTNENPDLIVVEEGTPAEEPKAVWEHEKSRDGLSLTSSTKLPEGGVWSVTNTWSDITTAKANYRAAAKGAERLFAERDKEADPDDEATTNLRVIATVFGRKIRVGRARNQSYDEAAIQVGSRKASVNLNEDGRWDGKTINFDDKADTSNWLAGVGGKRNAFYISIAKK
jgi:hypothetical protein